MSDQNSITQWIAGVRAGQSVAAYQLWNCYFERLVRLARQKLRDAPRRAADEEDVVLDAFDSFCRGAQQGRFPDLNDRDDLWNVLVMLTARKAINQRKHHTRQKRGNGRVRGESGIVSADDVRTQIEAIVGSEPTPEFAQMVSEEYRRLLDLLGDDTLRDVAVAKMEGYQTSEIAVRMSVRTRTVQRKLRVIRELWTQAGIQ